MKSFKSKQASLLSKYTDMYKQKPNSRVFAPLAETYRKLGMYEEAFKILNKGIKKHPNYTLGYIVIANCYHDKDQHEMAYNILRPHVPSNLENISLQKLFSKICEDLGYLDEALQTYKYLLLINPTDRNIAKKVKDLEGDLEYEHERSVSHYANSDVSDTFGDDDDWIQVSFNDSAKKSVQEIEERLEVDDLDNWSMTDSSQTNEQVLEKFKTEIRSQNAKVDELALDDEYYFEQYDNESEEVVEPEEEVIESKPIITHTLVDLFLKQGHTERAVEILKDILELHPDDVATREKLEGLKNSESESSEGHEELLNLIDKNRQKDIEKVELVENKLHNFLSMLKKTAENKCSEEL